MTSPAPNPFDNLIQLYLYRGGQIGRPNYLYDYILAAEGVVKRVENNMVSADHLLIPFSTHLIGLQLVRYPLHPIQLKIPRIPAHLLQEVLQDARRNVELEYMYQFRRDPQTRRWEVVRPDQIQTKQSVVYEQANPTALLDLHSHNTMPAFWSPTDDGDELGGKFYAVIGRLDRERPELALRLGLYGHWMFDVPAELLFDSIEPFVQVPAHFSRHTDHPGDYDDYWVEEDLPDSSGFLSAANWLNHLLPGGKNNDIS